ncbi:MAG TPA: ribosome-associated translation inhibitor RaiA [Polyangiaceae bacterium]
MNITVTFRHVDASPSIKERATEKIAKLQKFLRQPMTARVTVSLEKLKHQVEARVASGGERYEASETTEDMYTSIDKVIDKLERQIRGTKGVAQAKKRRSGVSLRRAEPEAGLAGLSGAAPGAKRATARAPTAKARTKSSREGGARKTATSKSR